MPNSGPLRWRGLAVLSLLATLLAPVAAGTAQTATGTISGTAYDDFTWVPIPDACATATSQADGTTYVVDGVGARFWIEDLPFGVYDVVVDDCGTGLHAPSTITNVEVAPPTEAGDQSVARADLTLFMTMEGSARITGRVIEDYGGYALKRKRVMTVDPETGLRIRETCTNNDGWYDMPAAPDTPVFLKFDDGCSEGGTHRTQWYPYSRSIDDAEALVPRTGSYVVAHGAMTLTGGFVGTVHDPSGEVPGYGWTVVAKDGYYLGGGGVRQDGSFGVSNPGANILVRFEPKKSWDGFETLYLVNPAHPSVPASWNVGRDDHYDLGLIALDRPPALAGRVVDSDGYPIEGAAVSFLPADEHGTVASITGTTDQQGWYVTNGIARGDYTAVVTVPSSDHDPWSEFNGTWLGNTPLRSQADIIHLTGENQGGIDFVVERGEASGIDVVSYDWDGPEGLTTDREYNGADWYDPLEVSTLVTTWAPASVGTFVESGDRPGFTSFPLGAIVVYDAASGAPAQVVELTLEPSFLPGSIHDVQVVWNDRRLGSCSLVGPPCLDDITIDERGDIVVSAQVTDGGEASFLWGPTFLDIGDSVFLGDIEWLADAGVTRGCSPPINDLFCPAREVTRGQMAAFLTRFLGLSDRGNTDFTDDDDSIFEADIEKLATGGITYGCNPPANDQFCPRATVTREQMAAFLHRAGRLEPAASEPAQLPIQRLFEPPFALPAAWPN